MLLNENIHVHINIHINVHKLLFSRKTDLCLSLPQRCEKPFAHESKY